MKPNGHGVVLYDPEKPHQPGREFECTYAFDSSQPQSRDYADQSTIYNCLGADMVMHGTTGYNCCLVAYGQTGTGKTHTVHGDWQSQDQRGLLPRIAEGLFERLASLPAGDTGRVRISYIEVYNDRLRDLLCTTAITARSEYDGSPRLSSPRTPRVDPHKFASGGGGNRLEVRTHPEVGVYVENLQELPVENLRDVARHVARGERAKKVERTTMNDRSSRSHTIFSFKVELRGAAQHNSLSNMQIVDLAGRENEQTSECKDERFRELRYINRSLFELANCIFALCDGNREHVPFRNSKLTMLLSDNLSSNSRTTLLATLTPSPKGFDENILTCRFLESTGRITTQPVVNRFAAAEVAKHLQDEIANLQSTKVEDEIISMRLTLLRQFSLVWAEEERRGSDQAPDEVDVVQGACRQVSQGLQSASQHLGRLELKNRMASEALKEVGSKLATLQHSLRAKGGIIRPASPVTTVRSARSDGEGDTLRRSLGLAEAGRRLSEEKVGTLRLLRLS